MKENNILPEPISGQDAFNEIIDYILGKDWYVVESMSTDQVNRIALEEIKGKYDLLTGRKFKENWNKIINNLKFKV